MGGFGKKAEDYRERLGIKQNALAQRVGLTASHLNRIEKGTRKPPQVEVVLAMIEALYLNPVEAEEFVELAGYSKVVLQLGGGFASVKAKEVEGQETPSGVQPAIPQLPATDQQFEEVKAELHELKAEVAEVKAIVNDLHQALGEIIAPLDRLHNPEKNALQPFEGETVVDIVKTLQQGEMMGKLIMNWLKKDQAPRSLEKVENWDEEWTRVQEQEGDFFVVMKGLQGMTLSHAQYHEQVRPILERRGEEAEFIRHALDRRERRRVAFERQVKKHLFRHVMPIGALEWYKVNGFHRPDDWGFILKGKRATSEQQATHIRHIIQLLDKYDNYQLGLLTGEAGETNLYNHFFWEIKDSHTVALEDLTLGEEDFIIKDPSMAGDFCRYFDSLWKSDEVIKDKNEVKRLLEKHIESLVKSSAIS